MMILNSIIICILCFCDTALSLEGKIVETTLGPIKGKLVINNISATYIYCYEGIPYAEPPVGNLRFKPPVPKKPWTTVLNATQVRSVCPQPEAIHSRSEMSEDCLYFNIFTPTNYLTKLLPVMVYIHTGHFKVASGNPRPIYGPQLFISEGIIVVTMNYRLGALGFLSLCTEEASGNAGIKDVLLVLKLIKSNIEKFGGDPNKITLAGHDAGGAIAQYLMFTNQSAGLFQRVMIYSATVLSQRFIQLHPRENAILLGKELGLNWKNDDCLLEQLKKVNAFDIIEAQEAITRSDPQRGFRMYAPFKPTVEIESPTAIVTRTPSEYLRNGEILNIPMIIGFNDQEGIEIFKEVKDEPELIDKLNANFELCIPAEIEYPYGSVERRNLASRIKDFYFDGKNITFARVQNYINLITDTNYVFGIDTFVKLYKQKKSAPVYYYTFNGDAELNFFKIKLNITYPGASHEDDIGYMFLTSVTKPIYQSINPATKRLLRIYFDNIKNFMLFGHPAPNPTTNCWPETGKYGYHLAISCEPVAVYQRPLPERIAFWGSVYRDYFNCCGFSGSYFCTNDNVRGLMGYE